MSEAKKEVPEGLVRRKGGPPVQAEGADAPAPAADAPAKDEQDDIIECEHNRVMQNAVAAVQSTTRVPGPADLQ